MKRFTIVLAVILLFAQNSICKGFKDYTSTQLYQVLCQVNGEWKKMPELANQVWSPFEDCAEANLLRTHLLLVEQFLRANPPADLTSFQMERRLHHLDVLNAYWKAGKFPNNPDFAERTPYFIGENGNFCAVGHLMWQDGQEEIVKLIEHEINTAYVREIPYAELGDWAFRNGFKVSELAWIQPLYGSNGEWVEGVSYEHLGGKTYRIWLHNAAPCINSANSQSLDTVGFVISPFGCTSPQPISISPWTEVAMGNVFNGCNPGMPCSSGGSGLPEIQRKYFYKDFNFTNTVCSTWQISKSAGPRIIGLTPGTMTGGQAIWLPFSTIHLNNYNTSPQISALPLPSVMVGPGNESVLHLGAIDPDGDSLVYALDTPRVSPSTHYNFMAFPGDSTVSYGNPLGSAYSLTVNPVTGDIEIAYKPGGTGYNRVANLLFRIDEYRNGLKINSTYQEMRLEVLYSTNQNPVFSDPVVQSGGSWNASTRIIEMCLSDSLVMDVALTANGASGNLTILRQTMATGAGFYNASTGIPTFQVTGPTPTARITYVPTQPGWYQIPLYGMNDHCPAIGTVQRAIPIWVKPAPAVAIQQDSVGCSSVSLAFPPGLGYNSWSWTGDFIQPTNDSVITVSYPQPGTYNYQIQAISPTGCPVSAQGQVQILNTGQPVFAVQTAQTDCETATFSVVPNSGNQPWSYSWTGSGGLSGNPNATDSTLSQTYALAGQYSWAVVVSDNQGCEVLQSGTVTLVDNTPGFTAGYSANGCDPIVEFNAIPDPGAGPYITEWSGTGGINSNPNRLLNTFQHIFPGPGTYSVSVSLTSSTGCDSTVSLQVVIPGINPPIFNSNDSLFTNSAVSYQWYRDSLMIPGANSQYFTGGVPGNYAVYVTDSNGCSGWSQYVFFDFITGILDNQFSFNVYPNPSSDEIKIDLSDNISGKWDIELIDLNGRSVIHQGGILGQSARITVSDYPVGLYFLRINHAHGTLIRKVQVSR